jgi:hypothetical protein
MAEINVAVRFLSVSLPHRRVSGGLWSTDSRATGCRKGVAEHRRGAGERGRVELSHPRACRSVTRDVEGRQIGAARARRAIREHLAVVCGPRIRPPPPASHAKRARAGTETSTKAPRGLPRGRGFRGSIAHGSWRSAPRRKIDATAKKHGSGDRPPGRHSHRFGEVGWGPVRDQLGAGIWRRTRHQ